MKEIELISKRLRLRFINISDLEDIHILHSLPETDEYNTLGIPKNIEETRKIIAPWISDNHKKRPLHFTFAIEEKTTDQFIGLISLNLWKRKYQRGEIWYKLHKDHWGKGFAPEALRCLLDFCFDELKLHRLEAGCAIDNTASIRVLEKVGMNREGCKKKVLPLKSGWTDNFEYGILEENYVKG